MQWSIPPSVDINVLFQVTASRIFAFVRQPAFLVHIADTLGPLAEKTCQQLVAYGRLDFRGIVDHILAEEQEHAAGEEGEGRPSTEQTKEALACVVMKLLQRRLVEQVCCLPLLSVHTVELSYEVIEVMNISQGTRPDGFSRSSPWHI